MQVNGATVNEVTALLRCEVPTATDWDEIKKILNLKQPEMVMNINVVPPSGTPGPN